MSHDPHIIKLECRTWLQPRNSPASINLNLRGPAIWLRESSDGAKCLSLCSTPFSIIEDYNAILIFNPSQKSGYQPVLLVPLLEGLRTLQSFLLFLLSSYNRRCFTTTCTWGVLIGMCSAPLSNLFVAVNIQFLQPMKNQPIHRKPHTMSHWATVCQVTFCKQPPYLKVMSY